MKVDSYYVYIKQCTYLYTDARLLVENPFVEHDNSSNTTAGRENGQVRHLVVLFLSEVRHLVEKKRPSVGLCFFRNKYSSGEPVTILKETPHNLHGPIVAEIEVKKSLARMKEVAAQGQDAPSRILNQELQGSLPAKYRPYLPKEATLKRAIQRERRKKIPEPPKSLVDLEIPDEWRTTSKGDNWLLADLSLEGTDRVWYGDGTFSVAPQHFYQLYTIHGVVLRQTLPLVYYLLTKKSYSIYLEMFTALKTQAESRDSLNISVITSFFDQISTKFRQMSIRRVVFRRKFDEWSRST